MNRVLSLSWKTAAVCLVAGALIWPLREALSRRASSDLADVTRFKNSGTTNFAAWEAFMRGRILINGGAAGFPNAIVHFERSVELDPGFVPGWVANAMAHVLLADRGFAHGTVHHKRAVISAKRAISLNSSSGRAFHWLGIATLALEYDLSRAEPMLRSAMALDPADLPAVHNFAVVLWFYSRFEEAEALLREVLRGNPSSGHSHLVLGQIGSSRGEFLQALKEVDESVFLTPATPAPYLERGIVRWLAGRRSDGADDLLRSLELNGFSAVARDDAVLRSIRAGNEQPESILRAIIELLETRSREGRFVSSFDLARFHALAENKAQALDYLEKAVDEHRLLNLSAKVEPSLKSLRGEPRYHAVLRRLNLEK